MNTFVVTVNKVMDEQLSVLSDLAVASALSALPNRSSGLDNAKAGLALRQTSFAQVQNNFQTVSTRRTDFQTSFAQSMQDRFNKGVFLAKTRGAVDRTSDGGFIVDGSRFADAPYGTFAQLDSAGNLVGFKYEVRGFRDDFTLGTIGYQDGISGQQAGLFSDLTNTTIGAVGVSTGAALSSNVSRSLLSARNASRVGVRASNTAPLPKFENLFPDDTVGQPLQLFKPEQLLKMRGRKLNYVVTQEGKLVIGRKANEVGGGHIDLAGGNAVQAAGEVKIVGGNIKYIDNSSGHYLPTGTASRNAALNAFRSNGFDVADSIYIEKFWDQQKGWIAK